MEIAQPSTNLNKTVKKIGAHSQNVNNTVKKIGAHSSIMGGCAPILLPKLSLTAAGNPASFRPGDESGVPFGGAMGKNAPIVP